MLIDYFYSYFSPALHHIDLSASHGNRFTYS